MRSAMAGASAVIVMLSTAGQQVQGGQLSAGKHWQCMREQLQAAAECLPAGLNVPLAIVLQVNAA